MKIYVSSIMSGLLFFFIAFSFLRDYIVVAQYLIETRSVPYWRIPLDEYSGYAIYLRDFFMLLWNIGVVIFFYKKRFLFFSCLSILFFLVGSVLLSLNNFDVWLLISEARMLNTLISVVGVVVYANYLSPANRNIKTSFYLRVFVGMTLISAIASIIEFFLLGGFFGSRTFGLFTMAAVNGYVLLFSIIALIYLRLYKKIKRNVFFILIFVLFFSLLTTGTRVAIVASILVLGVFILFEITKKKPVVFSVIVPFSMIFIMIGAMYFSNLVADRGNILSQSNGGRISKFLNIVETMSNKKPTTIIFGEGLGVGSNLAASKVDGLDPAYTRVDGTLNFFIVRFGVLGVFLYLISWIFIFFCFSRQGIVHAYLVVLPFFLLSVSVNIFEIPLVVLSVVLIYVFLTNEKHKR